MIALSSICLLCISWAQLSSSSNLLKRNGLGWFKHREGKEECCLLIHGSIKTFSSSPSECEHFFCARTWIACTFLSFFFFEKPLWDRLVKSVLCIYTFTGRISISILLHRAGVKWESCCILDSFLLYSTRPATWQAKLSSYNPGNVFFKIVLWLLFPLSLTATRT